jgi:homocysteine S-methyltransferase
MDRERLLTVLSGEALLADGGMGTALIGSGAPVHAWIEGFNEDDPDRVVSIHRSFVDAGSRLVLTNTFGANRYRLAEHGAADRLEGSNRAAVELARSVGPRFVGGSMGPLGVRLAPYGRVSPDDAFDAYREQALVLADAGVDLLMIETQTDLREMERALAAARDAAPDLAVLVSATFTRDDRTPLGDTPEQVASRLAELGADVIGVNCGEGPAQALRLVRAMTPLIGSIPFAARPNAGSPTEVGGRFVFPATPAYVGDLASALLDEGVAIVGGCCGMGPEHTRAFAAAVQAGAATRKVAAADGPGRGRIDPGPISVLREPSTDPARLSRPVEVAEPPRSLRGRLAQGRFVVAVEMEPPRSVSAATVVAAAETLRNAGADVVDVADAPLAKMRMSAWAACRLVQEQAGIETVLHFPTRGRSLLRLQGDLLGAHALGIRNLFVCVGDPVSIGDYPQSLNDVDVSATGLLALVTEGFNRGVDRKGASIGEPTGFVAGAAVAPHAPDLDREVRLLHRKVRSGAAFFLSQPVFSAEPLRALRAAYERVAGEPLEVPVLAGVLPLHSLRHAEFLHNEVPGIVIPGAVRSRLRAAGDDAWAQGRALASDLVTELRAEGVAGIYLMPQFGRYDLAAEVIETIAGD